MVVVRTEPRRCWAFVGCLVPHRTGAVNVRSRSTVSDKECHPEIWHIPSRPRQLLQPFLLLFMTEKKAATPVPELTRTMVMLHFEFCYAAPCLTFHSLRVLPWIQLWKFLLWSINPSILRKTCMYWKAVSNIYLIFGFINFKRSLNQQSSHELRCFINILHLNVHLLAC